MPCGKKRRRRQQRTEMFQPDAVTPERQGASRRVMAQTWTNTERGREWSVVVGLDVPRELQSRTSLHM